MAQKSVCVGGECRRQPWGKKNPFSDILKNIHKKMAKNYEIKTWNEDK